MAYSTSADLHTFGVPRGATPNPGRVLDSATGNTCTLDVHGFETGDAVLLRPAGDGAMPTGLAAGTTYYAQLETEHTFKLRATAGGAAISWTDATDPLVVVAPLDKAAAIEWADRMIDDMVTGQAVPFDDAALYPDGVPPVIKMTSAELAAGKLLAGTGSASRSIAEIVDLAQKRLERWSAGAVVKGTPAASRAGLAAAAPAQTAPANVAAVSDPRGWRRFGGL